MADGRLTDLRNNPYVELEPGRANTMKKGAGLVENDIRDITRCGRVLSSLPSVLSPLGPPLSALACGGGTWLLLHSRNLAPHSPSAA